MDGYCQLSKIKKKGPNTIYFANRSVLKYHNIDLAPLHATILLQNITYTTCNFPFLPTSYLFLFSMVFQRFEIQNFRFSLRTLTSKQYYVWTRCIYFFDVGVAAKLLHMASFFLRVGTLTLLSFPVVIYFLSSRYIRVVFFIFYLWWIALYNIVHRYSLIIVLCTKIIK